MPSTFNQFVGRILHYPRGFWERHVVRWGNMRAHADATSEKTYLTLLRAPEPSRRWQAAAGLRRHHLRSAEAITALIGTLCDEEPIVRWQAAEALAAQEASHAFPAVSAALDAADPLCRAGAAEVLGLMGGEAAAQALVKHLDDPEPHVRAAVATALGRIGDPTKVSALLPLLADGDPDVVRAAARALGGICDSCAAVPLAEALIRPDQPLLVRRALAAALARAPHPDAQPALLQALSDPDPQVRGYAAEALGHVGNEAAHDALAALRSDKTALLKGTVGDVAARSLTLLERRGRRAAPTPQIPTGPAASMEE